MVEEMAVDDPATSLPPGDVRDAAPSRNHNLPQLTNEFLGREKYIVQVLHALASRSFIICIEGMGGVGKTTLAIQTALYSLSDPNHLFERVVWISALHRPDQELWFNEVLDTIARELKSPALTKLEVEDKLREVQDLLRERPILVMIDNYETIHDEHLDQWISEGVPAPSKVLITSRASIWRNAQPIQLQGMENAEALRLIRNFCQSWGLTSLIQAPDDKLLPLIKVTEGNPKAIELALGHIRRGGLSLDEVIEHLHHANASVDDIFNDLYKRSWEKMHDEAKHVLKVIPFFPEPVKRDALGYPAGLMDYQLKEAVEELVQFMFLEVNPEDLERKPEYHTHPLIRAFGHKQLEADPSFKKEARQRWYEYYYGMIKREMAQGRSGDLYWDSLVRSGEATPIDEEWPNILNVLEWADLEGYDESLINLMLLLAHYMNRHFYYKERLYYTQKAAEAAERTQQIKAAALFRIDTLGWTLIETNRLQEAKMSILQGLQIAQRINPSTQDAEELIALAHVFLARVALQQGNLTEAAELMHENDTSNCRPVIQFRSAMITGDIVYQQGDIPAAIQHYEQAQQIGGQYRNQHGSEGEDEDLAYRMSIAYLAHGDIEKAERSFENLPRLERYATVTTGTIYKNLEEAYFAKERGDIEQARRSIEVALNQLSPTIESHWMLDEIRTFLKNLEVL